MEYVKQIRNSWKELLGISGERDLPYVLLTEVINLSVLRGASVIEVTYDGRSICVKDDAAPFEERPESLLSEKVGMMDGEAVRLKRLLERQWVSRPLALVNALCSRFSLVTGGDRLESVVCEDGEVVATSGKSVSIGSRNVVTMRPFLGMDGLSPAFLGRLLEWAEALLPRVTILYDSSVEEE